MTPFDVFVLVLRSIGIWTGVRAISALISGTLQVLPALVLSASGELSDDMGVIAYVLVFGLSPMVQLILSLLLLTGAPTVAGWYYQKPGTGNSAEAITVDSEAAYRMAARLLGVYAVLWGIRPISQATTAGYYHDGYAALRGGLYQPLLEAGLYFVVAVVLIFGSRRIGSWLGRLRYASPS